MSFIHPIMTRLLILLAVPTLSAATADRIARTVTFAEPVVSVTAEGYTAVDLEGAEPDVRSAKPVLPVVGFSVDLPAGATVTAVTLTPLQVSETPLAAPVRWGQPPRLPDEPALATVPPDPAIYQGATPYPDLSAPDWRTDPTANGTRVSIPLYPVRLDPANNGLLAARALVVDIAFTTQAAAPTVKRTLTPLSTSPITENGACTYLVISTSNLIVNTPAPWNLHALCQERARSGFTTSIVSTEWIYDHYDGTNNAARIRRFIQDAYNTWGVRYLLIAGSFDLIPVQRLYVSFTDFLYTRTGEIPSDAVYYGCMTGDFDHNGNGRYGEVTDGENGGDVDLTAEVMVGRFPVSNTEELSNMVRKTLRYESADATDSRPNAMIAEKLNFGTLIYGSGYMEELRWGSTAYSLSSLGYETSVYADAFDTDHTLYDSDDGIWTTADSLAFLNRDYLTVNHIGHGATKICMKISLSLTENQNALKAFTNSLPYFIYSQACDSGAFDTADCFAEQLVTVSNAAAAAVMNARSGWEYINVVGGYSHRFHRAFCDAALRGSATRLGEINDQSRRANLHFLTSYAANYWRWVYYELNLFGDPATPFARSLNAVAPELAHEPLINTFDTQTEYRVTCTVEPVGIYRPDAVSLVWQSDREASLIHTQVMEQVVGNQFEGLIPPQAAKTRIDYAILADNYAGYTGIWPETGETAFYVTERLDLDVRGSPADYGTVSPSYGVNHYPSGQVVVASAPMSVAVTEDTRFANTGFFGTGSVPQSGTNQTVTFQMDTHSLLVWTWQRQYRLTLLDAQGFFPTQTFWTAENGACQVPSIPVAVTNGPGYTFAEWRLDGTRTPAAPGYCSPAFGDLTTDKPHVLEAVYLPTDLDEDGNTIPDWWEVRYYGANGQNPDADDDQDGYTLAEEYADRSSPLTGDEVPSPPEIVHTALDETQTRPGPFTIRALISDTHAVADAVVRWHRKTEAWQDTPMTLVSNNLFEAAIGTLSAPGDDFEYQIIAADPTGLTAATDTTFFFLRYPLADFSRFHDLAMVGLSTQWIASTYMNLHNTGNADLVWTMRFARVESILSTDLVCWDTNSLGQAWNVTTNRCFSPPYALHSRLVSTGQANTPVRSSVTFPPTLLGPRAVLSFRYWINAEVYNTTTRAFDGGIVEYSLDGGATFEQLSGPYTHTIYGWGASPWPEGTPCFAGTGAEGWQTARFDLYSLYPEMNGFNGRTVVFRFHYGGDNNTDYEGWYIDDVTVSPLDSQLGFAHDIGPDYDYVMSAGDYKRILWSGFPSSMALRDDNISVLITSNDPVTPFFSFDWQVKVRDYPLLTGLSALQRTTGDGCVDLASSVFDRDGEPVTLAVQWSSDNGKHWTPASLTNMAAAFGSLQQAAENGTVADVATRLADTPATNAFSAAWFTREAVPAIDVSTQTLIRVTATNGYFGAVYTTPRFTVDNVPPAFLPGALTVAPLSTVGPYAITEEALTLTWPQAIDTPSTVLTYRVTAAGITNVAAASGTTLSLSNRLDQTYTFEVRAVDPAGNACEPLSTTLLVLDALGDYDGDGLSTADEEVAGTDASDSADRLAAALSVTTGSVNLSWPTATGRLYTVETSPALSPPDWQALPDWTDAPGTGAPLAFDMPLTNSNAFFRIRVRLP